jgi:hypothetical protein
MRYFYEVDPIYAGNLRALASFLLCQPFGGFYFFGDPYDFSGLGVDSLGDHCQPNLNDLPHHIVPIHVQSF